MVPSAVTTLNPRNPQPPPPIVCDRLLRLATVTRTMTVSPIRNDALDELAATIKSVEGAVRLGPQAAKSMAKTLGARRMMDNEFRFGDHFFYNEINLMPDDLIIPCRSCRKFTAARCAMAYGRRPAAGEFAFKASIQIGLDHFQPLGRRLRAMSSTCVAMSPNSS